ncbi:hypothetical protein RIF29_08689 [Crotalaria pallida]|uniref:Replication protein A 70 kDa DNA-binding subunit B/D first OB fold domain-containing protein n=1 Tax=Crotalaria pallida TaxID=3830 RepID=A0AAN9FR49_CROPI
MFEPHIRFPFRDIKPEVDYVAFRARVIVLVRVPTMRRVHSSYNIHMVLMDPFGDEIHAAIYGPAVSFFSRYVHEGSVYDFASFQVVEARGNFRLASHPFKLVFLFSTLFQRASSIYFPSWKLNTNCVDDICSFKKNVSHLQGRVLCSAVIMLLSWIAHSPPIVAYAGSRCIIENQLLGDFPTVSLGLLKNVNKAGYYTVTCTVVGISNATRWYYHECLCKAILADISSQSSLPSLWFKIPVVCFDSSATMTLYLLDCDARILLKRTCSDVLSLPSNSSHGLCGISYPEIFSLLIGCNYTFKLEATYAGSESNELLFYITRIGPNIVNFKTTEPKVDPITPELINNGNTIDGNGKSAFVPYQPAFKRTHMRRNLNKDYDVMLIGESSNSSFVPHTLSNETVDGSHSKDSLAIIPNPCDEAIVSTQTSTQ